MGTKIQNLGTQGPNPGPKPRDSGTKPRNTGTKLGHQQKVGIWPPYRYEDFENRFL